MFINRKHFADISSICKTRYAFVCRGKDNILVLKTTLSQYNIVNREDLKELFLLRDKRILHNFRGWEIS